MMILFYSIIPFGDLAYMIASIVMMFDYQEQATALNEQLLARTTSGDVNS